MERDAANPDANIVLNRALTAVAAFSDELAAELKRRLDTLWPNPTPDEITNVVRSVLFDFHEPLARIMTDAGVASWLTGAGRVADLIPQSAFTFSAPGAGIVGPPRDPFSQAVGAWDWSGWDLWLPLIEDAAKSLQAKRLVTRDEFDRLRNEERNKSFTVAGQNTVEAIGNIRDKLVDAVSQGTGIREFRKAIDEAALTSPIGPGTLETVFRTNVLGVYSDGMDKVLADPLVGKAFPYEEVMPIRDSRLTHLCDVISRSGIQGTGIYRREDPVYIHFRFPRHFNDRCGRVQHTIASAAKRGIREAQEWLRSGIPPMNPAYVPWPDVELPPGWRAAA